MARFPRSLSEKTSAKLSCWQLRAFMVALGFSLLWIAGLQAQPSRAQREHQAISAKVAARISHPLILPLDKEAFNLQSTLDAAFAEKTPQDLSRTIAGSDPQLITGLLSLPTDANLLFSYDQLVRELIKNNESLREELKRRYSSIADVRVNAAIKSSDRVTLTRAAVQFTGTQAAIKARMWLGDDQLAIGDFATARRHYQAAWNSSEAWQREPLESRLALIRALNGEQLAANAGATETGLPVDYADFMALLDELKGDRGKAASSVVGGLNKLPQAPRVSPAKFDSVAWGEVLYPVGWLPGRLAPEQTAESLDWFPRCFASLVDDNTLYFSNRCGVGAVDISKQRQRWYQDFSGIRGYPATWHWQSFRPLLVNGRLYCRRMMKEYPALYCVDANSGRMIWSADTGVITDPIWHNDRIVALTMRMEYPSGKIRIGRVRGPALTAVSLTQWDASTGKELLKKDLFQFHDVWQGAIPCRATLEGDSMVANIGSCVLRIDLDGELQWLRRLPFDSAFVESPDRFRETCEEPLIVDSRLIVFDPYNSDVLALNPDNGRIAWQVPKSGMDRVMGHTRDILVCSSATKVTGVDIQTGQTIWQRQLGRVLEACAVNGDKLTVGYRKLSNGKWNAHLAWIDLRIGDIVADHVVEGLERPRREFTPSLGPLIDIPGGILIGYECGVRKPKFREFLQLIPSKKTAATEISIK